MRLLRRCTDLEAWRRSGGEAPLHFVPTMGALHPGHQSLIARAARPILERDIERYLVGRVKALGGEVRKVMWIGRAGAPDRLVMLPPRGALKLGSRDHDGNTTRDEWVENAKDRTVFVELKNPDTIRTFPANARERAQHREHERMRKMGQRVEVIGTYDAVDALLA